MLVALSLTAPHAAAQPANNNFTNRIALSSTINVSTSGNNNLATKESGEPNHAGNVGGRSVWWIWTAPTNGMVVVTTVGSSFDTTLGVYLGNTVSTLTLVAGNDDGGGSASRVVFPARQGFDYKIAVDGYNGAQGVIQIHLHQYSSTVAVFDDPAFVDTVPDSGDPWPESDMVQASLTNYGIPKITFTDFDEVLQTAPVIVIPEQEFGDLATALPGATITAILSFVNWGGTLVVHGSDINANASSLINTILSPVGVNVSEYFSNNQGTKTYTHTGALLASSFGDDPVTIGHRNGTSALLLASLPPGASSIYSDSTNSAVTVFPYGTGQVIFLGRDWFFFNLNNANDIPWLPVLESTVNFSGMFTPKIPYDNFANSETLPSTFVARIRANFAGTKEAGEPNHAGNSGGRSVWWNVTPTTNGMVRVHTEGSSIDTVLAVYVGTSLTNLTLIASDDDSGEGNTSRLVFPARAGVNYKIAVDGYNGAQGSVRLDLTQVAGSTLAVFDDPAFVDTSNTSEAESDTVQTALTSLRFPVLTFTNFPQVLESSPVILIPELENGNLATALFTTNLIAMQNFVRWGGTLIVHGTYSSDNTATLINYLLGSAVTENYITNNTVFSRTVAANGTVFADNPFSLAWKDGTRSLGTTSLPVGVTNYFVNGTDSAVTVFSSGSGQIIYLGWDWFNYDPAVDADVGWLQVLASAASFSSQMSPAIPNNNFANRKLISLTNLIEFNFGTSKEAGEPNHAGNFGGRSLWWTWAAEADGMAVVTTSGSSIDTVLGVYVGTVVSNLTAIASNDDSGGTLQSKVTFLARRGVTYQIAVDGYNGAQGRINLSLQQSPVSVAVFDDPTFVNTGGGAGAESDSLQASLNFLTFPVVTFTNFPTALESCPVVSIPALNNGNLATALDSPTLTAIRDHMNLGGTLIVHGSYFNTNAAAFINAILSPLGAAVSESATSSGSTFTRTAAADGTTFTNAPVSIGWNDATKSLAIASLPPGSVSLYTNGSEAVIAVMPYGTGRLIFLGWDWYNAQPLGANNNGWLPVLASAVTYYGLFPATQPNDDFRRRLVLTSTSTNLVVSNVGATRDPYEPLHGGLLTSNSLWFSWTAPADGGVVVVAETDFPFPVPMLAVYTGTNIASLTNVTFNFGPFEGDGEPAYKARAAFTASGGQTYQIAVSGVPTNLFNPAVQEYLLEGSINFSLTFTPPPANDHFANAIVISTLVYEVTNGSFIGASRELSEPTHDSTHAQTLWWNWTAPTNLNVSSVPVRLTVDGASHAPALVVYTGNSLGALTPVPVTALADGMYRTVTFDATAGATYRIALAGLQTDTNAVMSVLGNFRFRLNTRALALNVLSRTLEEFLEFDGTRLFNVSLQVTNAGSAASGNLRVHVTALPGISMRGPEVAITAPPVFIADLPLSPLTPGQAADTQLEDYAPAHSNWDPENFDEESAIGYGVHAELQEQNSSGQWITVDQELLVYGDWPNFTGVPGPGGGVIRLDPGFIGLSAFNPLLSVRIVGPTNVIEGQLTSYYGRAGYADGSQVNFTNTTWLASVPAITNGLLVPKSVTANTAATLTAQFYNSGFLYNAMTNILVLNLPPPVLNNYVASGGNFVLQIQGVSNRVHVVEAATNLAPPVVWVAVKTNAVGATGVLSVTNAIGIFPQRFFRARELE